MKLVALFVLLGSLLVFAPISHAKEYSVNVKVGTLGVGVEGEYSINEYFGARLGANYFKYSYSGDTEDVNYDFDLALKTVSALVDYHPFEGSFRISTGLYYNGNKLDAVATAATSYDINGTTYTPTELGTLNGEVDFKKVAPYLGLGWDTSFGKESGFGFYCDLGAVFQGSPDAKLTANGTKSNDPLFLKDLAAEEAELQDKVDKFKIYPVVALGVSYRF